MKKRLFIYADDGKILTNNEIYVKQMLLAVGDTGDSFDEITEEEYAEIMAQKEKELGEI